MDRRNYFIVFGLGYVLGTLKVHINLGHFYCYFYPPRELAIYYPGNSSEEEDRRETNYYNYRNEHWEKATKRHF